MSEGTGGGGGGGGAQPFGGEALFPLPSEVDKFLITVSSNQEYIQCNKREMRV